MPQLLAETKRAADEGVANERALWVSRLAENDRQHAEAVRLLEERTHHAADSTHGRGTPDHDAHDQEGTLDQFGTHVGREGGASVVTPFRDGGHFIEAAASAAEVFVEHKRRFNEEVVEETTPGCCNLTPTADL